MFIIFLFKTLVRQKNIWLTTKLMFSLQFIWKQTNSVNEKFLKYERKTSDQNHQINAKTLFRKNYVKPKSFLCEVSNLGWDSRARCPSPRPRWWAPPGMAHLGKDDISKPLHYDEVLVCLQNSSFKNLFILVGSSQ